MTVKTEISRFHIHDELTAPEGSLKILKGIRVGRRPRSRSSSACSPEPPRRCAPTPGCAPSCAPARCPGPTRERIALAVAERRGDPYSIAQHARTARAAGLGLDEISRARSFESGDHKEAALLAFLEVLLAADGRPTQHLAEEARELGWTDEELLEAVAHVALNEFQSLIANAAELPQDQVDSGVLPAAA